MHKFENGVQLLKHKVLKEVATRAYAGTLKETFEEIPAVIIPDSAVPMRGSIEKDREIAKAHVKMAMGGDSSNPNVIEPVPVACYECPVVEKYVISEFCRGCVGQACITNCPKNAITKREDGKAYIDQGLCISCGRCEKVCPYSAVMVQVRPCERSCKVGAITREQTGKAGINNDKCVSCGACTSECPFGAMMDKSFMTQTIDMIQRAEKGEYKLAAVIAPAIASQFTAPLEKVITAIKVLGFDYIVEAAMGADMVAKKETEELMEKDFLTSSCCPAFVEYIKKHHPALADHISHNLSPMAEVARFIKEQTEMPVKTVFIGPCTAKKAEQRLETVRPWIDNVLTFEELLAMLEAKGIDIKSLDNTPMVDASPWGRMFGRSGGLAMAVTQVVKEMGSDFEVKAEICDGLEACKMALLKAKTGKLDKNFIEGMACLGGCVGGAASLTHEAKGKMKVDQYGDKAVNREVNTAIEHYTGI